MNDRAPLRAVRHATLAALLVPGCSLFVELEPPPSSTPHDVAVTSDEDASPDDASRDAGEGDGGAELPDAHLEDMPPRDASHDAGHDAGAPPWHAPGWSKRVELTVRHDTEEPLTGLTALVVLNRDRIALDHIQPRAQDLRFVTSDGRRLPHEVEWVDGDTGEVFVWVEVPGVDPGIETSLWMYYHNPSAEPDERPEELWRDYAVVHHFSSQTKGALPRDSSGNRNDARDMRPTVGFSPGLMGQAAYFSSARRDFVSLGTLPSLDSDPGSSLTVQIWYFTPTVPLDPDFLFSNEESCAGYGLTLTESARFGSVFAGRFWYTVEGATPGCADEQQDNHTVFTYDTPTSRWAQLTLVIERNAERMALWHDGERSMDEDGSGVPVGNLARGGPWTLGSSRPSAPDADFFTGGLDELRVFRGARSPEWIALGHVIGRDQFLSYGAPEAAPTRP